MPLPSAIYQQKIAENILTQDPAQESILPCLDALAKNLNQSATEVSKQTLNGVSVWHGANIPKGVFLCGEVGRGKSMLMQLLFDAVEISEKRRVHFHPFMEEMHERMHDTKTEGNQDIVMQIASELAKNARLLCFDEFYVTNIGDAILLGRLLEALFKCGVTLCATSNWKIEDLYQDGHNRSLFQPFIKIVQNNIQEVDLSSEHDWRRKNSSVGTTDLTIWFANKNDWEKTEITLLQHQIIVENWQDGVVICSFKNMCDTFIGRSEYMDLCAKASGVIITDIPKLGLNMADSAMRFVVLVDLLYENQIPLIVTTLKKEDNIENICEGGPVAFAFKRTLSRIIELGKI